MQKVTKRPTAMPTICPVLNDDGSVVAMASMAAEAAAVDPLMMNNCTTNSHGPFKDFFIYYLVHTMHVVQHF